MSSISLGKPGPSTWPDRQPSAGQYRLATPKRIGPGVAVSAVVVAILMSVFIKAIVTAPAMQWNVFAHYLFFHTVLAGLLRTIELTFICEALAIISAGVLAWMLISGNVVWQKCAHCYQWFFRAVPELAQLIFWFNLALLFPHFSIGIPFIGPTFYSTSMNHIMRPWIAVIIGIALHEGAYLAEVFRAGVASIDPGQVEAGLAVGLTRRQAFRQIVLPQAMNVIVPNAGSRLIGLLKATSLASVLAVSELLYSVETIYNTTLQTIPLLLVASVWYMVCVALLRFFQARLERYYESKMHADTRLTAELEEEELAW